MLFLGLVGTLAILSVSQSDGDWGQAVWTSILLGGMFGLLVLYTEWEKRSRGRRYEARWRSVCHVLGEDHNHEGTLLTGRWKGMPFRAHATAFIAGQYAGTVTEYSITMPTTCSGPAWRAERVGATTASKGSDLWKLRADTWSMRERLVEAGLLDAIDEAEQGAVEFGPAIRVLFRPETMEVAYEDESGATPGAKDLVVHLELVRRAVDVHGTAIAAMGGQPEGGPRLRVGDPPLWAASLWFPAALVSVVTVDRWPWSFALLVAALAAPYLWRVRMSR